MADAVAPTPPPADESPAQRQARQRREKRNARLQAEGADRLSKITQLSGRPAPAIEGDAPPQPTVAPDPDEVDISEHHWTPQPRQNNALQKQQDPFAGMPGFPAMGDGANDQNSDPMMQMMQQLMGGGGGGNPNDPNAPNLPPFLQQMMAGQQGQSDAPKSNSAYLWRIVHAVFALTLALYVSLTSTFNGSKLSRAQSIEAGQGAGPRLFYTFATTELVLQGSRYFLEKGQLKTGGMLATILNTGMVPEPWAGYLRIVGRYSVIWQTIVGDATTIVFVLGCLAWWQGMAAA